MEAISYLENLSVITLIVPEMCWAGKEEKFLELPLDEFLLVFKVSISEVVLVSVSSETKTKSKDFEHFLIKKYWNIKIIAKKNIYVIINIV